jgi:hypothetical protein
MAKYLANLDIELKRIEAERLAHKEEQRRLAEERARLKAAAAAWARAGEDEDEMVAATPPAPAEEIDASTLRNHSCGRILWNSLTPSRHVSGGLRVRLHPI